MLIFHQVERQVLLARLGVCRGALVVFTHFVVDFERTSLIVFHQTNRLPQPPKALPKVPRFCRRFWRVVKRMGGRRVQIKACPASEKEWRARRESNPRPSA